MVLISDMRRSPVAKPRTRAKPARISRDHTTWMCNTLVERMVTGTKMARKSRQRSQGSDLIGMPMMLMANTNCNTETNSWVQRLATAEPHACIRGINNKLTVTLITIPMLAMIFNCFILPLAVSKVPKR